MSWQSYVENLMADGSCQDAAIVGYLEAKYVWASFNGGSLSNVSVSIVLFSPSLACVGGGGWVFVTCRRVSLHRQASVRYTWFIRCDKMWCNWHLDQWVSQCKSCIWVGFDPVSFTARLVSWIEIRRQRGFDLARRITGPRARAMMANGMALAFASARLRCRLDEV